MASSEERLRVAVDARPITSSHGGIAAYCRGLIDGWDDSLALEGFLYDKNPAPADVLLPSTLSWRTAPGRLWIFRQAPRMMARDRIDVFHGSNFMAPPFVAAPTVVTIHDLSLLTRMAHQTARNIALTLPQMMLSLSRATLLIADSHATAKELAAVPLVDAAHIRVVHLATSPRFFRSSSNDEARVRTLYDLPETFFLFVGAVMANKNVPRVVQALAALKDVSSPPTLVIAGRGGQDAALIKETASALNVSHLLKYISYVEPGDLPSLYSAALALVYPSLFEGFGLPPLEAMACGTPVITSNVSSLPEVVGDAALSVDPYSVSDLTAAMRRILDDCWLRDRLRAEGPRRAALFSWEKTMRETADVYREAAVMSRRKKGRSAWV